VSKPYLLVSDLHLHAWSSFATYNEEGTNGRLKDIVRELRRAVFELKNAGGDEVVIAGDLFHVRGQLDPEVFNYVHDAFLDLVTHEDVTFFAIPGNHDLKGKETTRLGNAFQSLNALLGFVVITEPTLLTLEAGSVIVAPWMSSLDKLREEIKGWSGKPKCDLVIHAGINGVISGMPDHALEASEVADWGFNRVFAGHYHNHKRFCKDSVVSIGALTHQTWSDVGTKAGFMLVYPDHFEHRESNAPSFVEINEDTAEDELPLIVEGNYVRVRGAKMSDKDINAMRGEVLDLGALGFSYQGTREVVTARAGPPPRVTSLAASVGDYIATLPIHDDGIMKKVVDGAMDILTNVQAGKLAEKV
jgi:DNA repair exonuclease SbcCD nuclease subunit